MNALDILDGIATDARYAKLKPARKEKVDVWANVMRAVLPAKPRETAIAEQAARLTHLTGFSRQSIERRMYKFLASGDWFHALTDGRACANREGCVSDAEKELFRAYAGQNQRAKIRPAWKQLLNDLRAGELLAGIGPDGAHGTWRDLWAREFPGRQIPEHCPLEYQPTGWSYDNFYRCRPTKYELKAITVGRGAAAKYRPQAMTTRIGSYVGQGIFIDDLWHDQEVNMPGVNRRSHWPLELAAMDFTSACKFLWGFRPEVEKDDGTRQRIREHETLWFLAHLLVSWGCHPDGTTLFVEHGTTGVSEEKESLLANWFGRRPDGAPRLMVERSGILKEEAFAGLFEGRGRGNPNFKALLESSHSYFQNAIAHLPGRKGKDWDSTPAGLDKQKAYNANAIAAMALMNPELAAQFRLPVPLFTKWRGAVNELYRIVNHRDKHRIEGWEECGYVTAQYRITEHSQEWTDERDFLALPATTQALLHEAVRANPQALSRRRNLSPAEVCAAGHQGFITLPVHLLPQWFGMKLAQPVVVSDSHEIVFPGGDIYEAEAWTEKNRMTPLRPGDGYAGWVNPYDERHLLLAHEDGGFVGVCKRRERVAKFDERAMNEHVRDVMRKEAELLRPLARRGRELQQQILEDREANLDVMQQFAGAAPAAPAAKPAQDGGKYDAAAEALRRAELRRQQIPAGTPA